MGALPASASQRSSIGAGQLLCVDDDPEILDLYDVVLKSKGYDIKTASSGSGAVDVLKKHPFDLIVSDIAMPGMDGIQFLRRVREVDREIPVVLVTGAPSVETAMKAVELGAMRYMIKPIEPTALQAVVDYGVKLSRLVRLQQDTIKSVLDRAGDTKALLGLSEKFDKALQCLVLHYQPIVSWSRKSVFAYEVLIRTQEAALTQPVELFGAAESLKRTVELSRAIRVAIAHVMKSIPENIFLFVNLHPQDLTDPLLFSEKEPLLPFAKRVALELSERGNFDSSAQVQGMLQKLRTSGFQIALDDLGAGNAGLETLAKVQPDVVKLDMALVRGSERESFRRKLIQSISNLSSEAGMRMIIEGVETPAERDAMVSAGCDLMQGYLFGRPERVMTPALWL